MLVFQVDFVLKIKDNLSWIGIKHKTKYCQGENSSMIIHKMHTEKVIKENSEVADEKKWVN